MGNKSLQVVKKDIELGSEFDFTSLEEYKDHKIILLMGMHQSGKTYTSELISEVIEGATMEEKKLLDSRGQNSMTKGVNIYKTTEKKSKSNDIRYQKLLILDTEGFGMRAIGQGYVECQQELRKIFVGLIRAVIACNGVIFFVTDKSLDNAQTQLLDWTIDITGVHNILRIVNQKSYKGQNEMDNRDSRIGFSTHIGMIPQYVLVDENKGPRSKNRDTIKEMLTFLKFKIRTAIEFNFILDNFMKRAGTGAFDYSVFRFGHNIRVHIEKANDKYHAIISGSHEAHEIVGIGEFLCKVRIRVNDWQDTSIYLPINPSSFEIEESDGRIIFSVA